MGVCGGSVGIEDDAEGVFGILRVRYGFWDEIAETFDREERRGREVEIYDEDGDGRDGGEGRRGSRVGEKGGQP